MANIRAAKEETPAGARFARLLFLSSRSRPARVPCSAKHRPNLLALGQLVRRPVARSSSPFDRPVRLAEIDEQHLDLASIVRVDGSGRIQDRDAVVERKSGPRPDLRFESGGQFDRKTGRDELSLAWRENDLFGRILGADKIETGCSCRLIGWGARSTACAQRRNRTSSTPFISWLRAGRQ